MNIAYLTTGLDYGGAETELMHLAARLKGRGWPVRVVSMLPPRAYIEELEAAGIPVDSLNMRRGVP
ncbi:MAG: glycosyltransferase, partial [Candidatus Hadarchaeum sp.]